ncbi:MAG: GAF domain-containing protein, partial [Sphaerobacteraceae bacterium]
MDQDPRLDEARIMEILSAPNRLRELERLGLLDSFRVDAFDRLTDLAARLLDVQTSLLSIIDADRQFFKSSAHRPDKEDEVSERPLSYSFCKYVVGTDEPLILDDAAEHPVIQHNLGYVELGVRAYAGFPVRSRSGVVLGSFCVLDETPRHWSSDDLQTLQALTDLVIDEVRLREVMIDLASEREEHTALLDGMSEGVIGVNREGECTFANPTACTILGWPEDELRGSTIHGA